MEIANGITAMRLLVLAPFLGVCSAALADGRYGVLSLLLFALAALSDFVDGRVARHRGTASGAGQTFDHVTDMAFVTVSLVFFAINGRISGWVPAAVALAVATYLRDLWWASRRGDVSRARNGLGHGAGVMNYAMVGLLSAELVAPLESLGWLVILAGLMTVGLNVGAVLVRFSVRGNRDQAPSLTAARVRRPRLMPTNGSATTP